MNTNALIESKSCGSVVDRAGVMEEVNRVTPLTEERVREIVKEELGKAVVATTTGVNIMIHMNLFEALPLIQTLEEQMVQSALLMSSRGRSTTNSHPRKS